MGGIKSSFSVLTHLKIKNYALIDHLEVSFSEGLTCITGETGAGKSILLGGLSLVLGKRADLSSLLNPKLKCIVEATFEIDRYHLKERFEMLDIDYDPITVLRRELLPQGKSRAFVNDSPVNLAVLEEISATLIDVHSQHENQLLSEGDFQFQLLDALAKNDKRLNDYQSSLKEYKRAQNELERLRNLQNQSQSSLTLKQFLFEELEAARLVEGMEEELVTKRALLSHVEFLGNTLTEAIQLIESETIGIADQLYRLRSLGTGLAQKSEHFTLLLEQIRNIVVETEDVLENCKQHFDQLEADPEALEQLEQRWDALQSLYLKHQMSSVSDLISLRDNLGSELDKTLNLDQVISKITAEVEDLKNKTVEMANDLSICRKQTAPVLEQELLNYLNRMGMPEAQLKIEISASASFGPLGSDQLRFLFTANKGGEFKEIKKVASGGELSRIMLAIKSVLSRFKKLPTLIFDEIDTGVSGKISDSVAGVMAELSKKIQVFTITHLPQVAAKGDHHIKVEKLIKDNRTYTHLYTLNEEERVHEIALMLSGNQLTSTALAHAKQLMN